MRYGRYYRRIRRMLVDAGWPVSPSQSHADVEGMVVVAAADLAVVAEIDGSRLGYGGAGQKANDRCVALYGDRGPRR